MYISLAAERENLDIVGWCYDLGKSAYRGEITKRPGIQHLLKEIENGVEAVCFYDETRISRKIEDFFFDVYLDVMAKFPNVKFY